MMQEISAPQSKEIPIRNQLPLSVEEACWKATWPKDKPVGEIVFPSLLSTRHGVVTALWLMMSRKEIASCGACMRYNEFSFLPAPYPMVLWLTVLYSHKLEPKWLPCYLDLQSPQNRQVLLALAEKDSYPLVFFTLEKPHLCHNVMSSRIAPAQRQILRNWLESSHNVPSALAQVSKNLLKDQYQQVKPRILKRLASLSEKTSLTTFQEL